jgi:trans-2,3-dihydro-3-hydroxyanthranilate isomerase
VSLEFVLADVFSDRPFGGNQLAVFPDASGISDVRMQQLAREFNFSETTFVLPPADPACTHRVRIFTPVAELPFAGHPTIGTAAVLADLAGDRPGRQEFAFEEGIGPLAVEVDGPGIRFFLRPPRFSGTDEAPPAAAIGRALGLGADAITETWYAQIGLRFCFVRVATSALVDQIAFDRAAWAADIAGGWSPNLYCFSGDYRSGERLNARFFAPAAGVDEDPATGSACATLAASAASRSPEPDGTYQLHVDQGVAMGRASVLAATARKEGGRITEVSVGGQAVIVGRGLMTLPAG